MVFDASGTFGRTHGPLFDGRADAALDGYTRAAKLFVAHEAKRRVLQRLSQVLKNPTGHYEGAITVVESKDPFVSDGDIVYGPWLEGVGSRNVTTRFKGYKTFRLVAQKLQSEVGDIAQRVLPPFLVRMN